MNFTQKSELIREKNKSNLVIGLDTDLQKIPVYFLNYKNPALEFNKAVIDCTKDICAGYKLNIAFYEYLEESGIEAMRESLKAIPDELIKICDAKRGDIDNTAEKYAEVYFDKYNFDSVTISPYMGTDSIKPFIKRNNKHVFVLALTSNNSYADFEMLKAGERHLYEHVTETILSAGSEDNTGFVFGANHLQEIKNFSEKNPGVSLLIPGIGAQGNDPAILIENVKTKNFVINSSREIIYAAEKEDSLSLISEKIRTSAVKLNKIIRSNEN
ncbi:MAG: orotidine-5'-phosphate decarboxylase [Ignavibacteria bacterium]|nr:orotidine-5'-phosphate decarboxylase [Ignavibacteria bacterium]